MRSPLHLAALLLAPALLAPSLSCKPAIEKSAAKMEQCKALMAAGIQAKYALIETSRKKLADELGGANQIPFMDGTEPLVWNASKQAQEKAEELRTLGKAFEGIEAMRQSQKEFSERATPKEREQKLMSLVQKETLLKAKFRLLDPLEYEARRDNWLAKTIEGLQAHANPSDFEKRYLKALLATREYLKGEQKLGQETFGKVEAVFKG